MPAIFEALPGLEVPVGAIAQNLARMWSNEGAPGAPPLDADDAKATQANFVLHLGFNTELGDAVRQFETVLNFSRRTPSRVVVLCPLQADVPGTVIRAKIFGECFLGRSKSDKRCVEFVILSYSRGARPFLENQVSICLSTDLPLYYWAHRFSASGRLADYRYLLGRAQRVLIDSAISPPDALTYLWPNSRATRDLVYSRLLPVRQTVGQFLAAYPPAQLIAGLVGVTVAHDGGLAAEARVLLAWLRRRLLACEVVTGTVNFSDELLDPESADRLAIRFIFADPAHFFRWSGDLASGQAVFEAELGSGATKLAAVVSLLKPEAALSEAMFF
ncbi:MAG: hypothetical protein RL077_1196 [Verrucomicrobiota bacterium]|jgi:hypothetical protein